MTVYTAQQKHRKIVFQLTEVCKVFVGSKELQEQKVALAKKKKS